jgi:hypothetical protein
MADGIEQADERVLVEIKEPPAAAGDARPNG